MDGIPLTSLHPPKFQGLPPNFQDIIKAALSSPNELAFRRAISEPLIHARVHPKLRQATINRAITLYRAQSPSAPALPYLKATGPQAFLSKAQRGGKYHKRVKKPGGGYRYVYHSVEEPSGKEARVSWLKNHVQRILDKHDDPLDRLRAAAERYGYKEVACAINECGGYDKLRSLQKGRHVAAAGAGGIGGGSSGEPTGARKVWNNTVVEKQPDGSWKKVSTLAGLEGGERVPKKQRGNTTPLANLTKEQADHLIEKLKQKKQKQKTEDQADPGDTL